MKILSYKKKNNNNNIILFWIVNINQNKHNINKIFKKYNKN